MCGENIADRAVDVAGTSDVVIGVDVVVDVGAGVGLAGRDAGQHGSPHLGDSEPGGDDPPKKASSRG